MSIRLDGTNPLSYMGVTPVSPPQFEVHGRAPTANDTQNFNLGTIWLERDTENFWILSSLTGGVAVWTPFSNGADTFNTDVGGPAIPLNGVLNVLGEAGTIVTVGAGNTIFIGAGVQIATTYETDAGDAIPAANILKIVGGPNINTEGAANVVTVNLNNSIILPATTADELSGVISIGAGPFIHAYGTDNAFFGLDAGNFTLTTALRNNSLGKEALSSLTTGDDNLALSAASLTSLTTGSRNIAAGSGAMGLATSSSDCISIGNLSLNSLLTGTGVIAIGIDAGDAYVAAESNNILIGNIGVAAESNVIRIGALGSGAGQQDHTYIAACYSNFGTNNVFVGTGAGNTTLTTASAIRNVSAGVSSLSSLTLGADNVALGDSCMMHATDASENVAIGQIAMRSATTSDQCVLIGSSTGSEITTGSFNTGLGWSVFTGSSGVAGLLTGNYNVGIGDAAANAFTGAESSNICINSQGVVGDSNTLRIGVQTGTGNKELNRAFIQGIRGITTGVADAVAVLIDSAGQLGTVSSSARYKENITDMADASDAIMNLRPVAFNYKTDSSKSTVYGLIAEEVAEAMPYLAVKDAEGLPETVKYHDLPVLLLNELKKLKQTVDVLQARIVELEKR